MFVAWSVPHRQPVVLPERQMDAPMPAWLEPWTRTLPLLWLYTQGCGVHEPLVPTHPMSLPGQTEPRTLPMDCQLKPSAGVPAPPQCPAVTKPPTTEKPTEQAP